MTAGIKIVPPSQAMIDAKAAVIAAIRPYADETGPQGILALFAQLTGMSLAYQDASLPHALYMQMVAQNLEQGNADAVDQFISEHGGKN